MQFILSHVCSDIVQRCSHYFLSHVFHEKLDNLERLQSWETGCYAHINSLCLGIWAFYPMNNNQSCKGSLVKRSQQFVFPIEVLLECAEARVGEIVKAVSYSSFLNSCANSATYTHGSIYTLFNLHLNNAQIPKKDD